MRAESFSAAACCRRCLRRGNVNLWFMIHFHVKHFLIEEKDPRQTCLRSSSAIHKKEKEHFFPSWCCCCVVNDVASYCAVHFMLLNKYIPWLLFESFQNQVISFCWTNWCSSWKTLKSGNESTARQLKFRNVIHHRCKVEGRIHPLWGFF